MQCVWLAVGDFGLSQHAWACATMWPCCAMDEEGVADIHVAGAACRMGTRALEGRRRQISDHVAKEHSSFAKGREQARDVEVRADEELCRGVLWTDIREQEQRKEPAVATVHVHPPLAIHLVAPVNVPAGVTRILHTGEAHRNASSHALPPNPTTWSEERVVRPMEHWRRARGSERGALGAQYTNNRRNPRRGIMGIDTDHVQLLLNCL
jgi:hypothetical protein